MTTTTRRSLLAAGALGAALAPVLRAPAAWAAATTSRDLYVRTRFSSLRRTSFRLDGAGRHWRVRLSEVRNLQGQGRDQHRFSLVFRTAVAGPEQGSYVLRRPGFRPTTLFLVPIGGDRRTYEAVVYRRP